MLSRMARGISPRVGLRVVWSVPALLLFIVELPESKMHITTCLPSKEEK
jgi:hypothetical protein